MAVKHLRERKNLAKVKTEAFAIFYFRLKQNGIILIYIGVTFDMIIGFFSENNAVLVFKNLW